jgi:DNA-binding IclR family transcriptional regulator
MKHPLRRTPPPSGTQSICRALDVLATLAEVKSDASITELAALMKLHVSTVSRVVGALETYDLVVQDPITQRIQLGPRCFQLGQVFAERVEVAAVAEPFMHSLTARIRQPTHLGVMSEDHLVHIKHVEPEGYVMRLSAGQRYGLGELYCEAMGKVLLAFSPDETIGKVLQKISFKRYTPTTITSAKQMREEVERIRERGYAVDNGERSEEVRCVAVPIWDHNNVVAAGLSTSGTERQITRDRIQELSVVLRETSEAISHRLGASSSRTGKPRQ